MDTKNYFDILVFFEKEKEKNLEKISKSLNLELNELKESIEYLKINDYLDKDFYVTKLGYEFLKDYKVDNAIIMAAGMSSRFAPLSYEKPKSLLEVNGEVLIERQIRQLQEAGISNIIVVVGYMKEKFFYLKEKFNIDIVENDDYFRYNNTSSLIRVVDKLNNTYICSSDNYFLINPFEKYVFDSYYSCIYADGKTDEYCVTTDKNGRITDVVIGGNSSWIMLGHVYFNKNFSKKFREILIREYENDITKTQLWEILYIRFIDELEMYIKKYSSEFIKEFDSLDELRVFDKSYLNDTRSEIIRNICKILKAKEEEIVEIFAIKNSENDLSFSFKCNSKKYIFTMKKDNSMYFVEEDTNKMFLI